MPILIGLFVLWFIIRGAATTFTDYLFFSEVGFTAVFRKVIGSQFMLVLGFAAIFFAFLWGNLVLADRFAPEYRPLGPGDEIVARYREVVGNQTSRLRLILSIIFSLVAGFGASGEWNNWILFRNGGSFGIKDPVDGLLFHRDVGFYVFKLPFLQFLVGWTFTAVLVTALLTAVAHYLNGGIRLAPAALDRVTPQVRAHLSLLFAGLALVKAVGYLVQRWTLMYSGRGIVQGASYTDLKARLPAINLLLFASLVAAVLLVLNVRRRGWTLPGVAIGLWLVLSVVVGAIFPAAIQALVVSPSENSKERPYIERNIKATREALGIGGTNVSPYSYQDDLSPEDLAANEETIRNIRVWDPAITRETYESLQSIKGYYEFNDVDADRYTLNGRKTAVLTSARELSPSGLPDGTSWVNRHLQYTHGNGAVVAPANAATPDGNPQFSLQDVPPVGEPKITQPRVYFGENLGGYAVVNSKQKEIDTDSSSSNYAGKGGVALSSFVRKTAFAIRFGELKVLISGQITPKSRAIFYRDVADRVRKAAPFLKYDGDPYPVVIDGRILWVIDAYTITNHYPYAQVADTSRLDNAFDLKNSDFNYIRNSVKVTVDAFDGTMKFYRVDEKDPIAKAYAKAFPRLFSPADSVSEDLKAHFRYPEDLFRVQTTMFGRYHLTNPDEWFNASDAWNVAPDPGTGTLVNNSATPTTTNVLVNAKPTDKRMDPYYVLTRLPSDQNAEFQILQPFVPRSATDSRRNLTAFMVAKSDPGSYGKLEAFVMPDGQQVAGPELIASEMQSDPTVASAELALSQSGSRLLRGNIVMLPIGRSIIAVRPLYVEAQGRNSFPQLRKVIVWHANDVSMGDSLSQALAGLFGTAPTTGQPTTPTTPTTPSTNASVGDLLARAAAEFDAADAALRNGDLAGYQSHVRTARDLTNQARTAANNSGTTPATTTTTRQSASA